MFQEYVRMDRAGSGPWGCKGSTAGTGSGRAQHVSIAELLSYSSASVQSPCASSPSSCLCGLIEFGQWWLHSAHETSSWTICWERQPKGVTPWAFNWHLIQYQELMTLERLQHSFPHPFPGCPAFCEQQRETKFEDKRHRFWKYLNKSSYDDMDESTASTFMLLRLISVRLGSFAFILCKLASTLVGLGGSSKMGLTFSPFTTSATQNLIKCHRSGCSFPFRFALPQSRKGLWAPQNLQAAVLSLLSLPCPLHPLCSPSCHCRLCSQRLGSIVMGKFLLYTQNPWTINWSQSSFEGYCLGCDILQGLLCALSNICKERCAQNLPIILGRKCACTYE